MITEVPIDATDLILNKSGMCYKLFFLILLILKGKLTSVTSKQEQVKDAEIVCTV